ncbi:hypothetical protein LTR94_031586, partial [Friedmanniomyces endolithicus]
NSYRVEEQVAALYVRLDFDGQAAARPYFGNAGLRMVRTRTHVEGARMVDADGAAQVLPLTHDGEDAILLPSLNLKANLTDQLILRFAASKNMSPPSFSQLNSTFSISPAYQNAGDVVPTGVGTGTSNGNALLKPEKVTQYDVALEWYFSPIGYLYGTVFKKDITDLIFSVSNTETYDLTGSNGTVL